MIYVFSMGERKALVRTEAIIDFNDPTLYKCMFLIHITSNIFTSRYKVGDNFWCHSDRLSIPTREELSHLSEEYLIYGV